MVPTSYPGMRINMIISLHATLWVVITGCILVASHSPGVVLLIAKHFAILTEEFFHWAACVPGLSTYVLTFPETTVRNLKFYRTTLIDDL